jgi:hypothetical protein
MAIMEFCPCNGKVPDDLVRACRWTNVSALNGDSNKFSPFSNHYGIKTKMKIHFAAGSVLWMVYSILKVKQKLFVC